MPYHNPNQNVVTATPSTTSTSATIAADTTTTTTPTISKPCTLTDMNFIAGFTVTPVYVLLQQQSIPVPGSGGLSTFLGNMWNHYLNQGCSWWTNRVNHWQSQLPSITNPYHFQLKTAKIAFGQQMHTKCNCSGIVPVISINPNIYTVNIIPINGILDSASSFPPTSKYKFTITPDPEKAIQAAQYSVQEMLLSYEGDTNSHTKWPSRFQYTAVEKEDSIFYKIVLTDSTNPRNDLDWDINDFPENEVYIWVYFGKNETTPIRSSTKLSATINVNYDPTTITASSEIDKSKKGVASPEKVKINTITSFKI